MKIAIILTVYNRRDVTLQGLRSLYGAIAFLGEGYSFDVYMTNDGCTDGTGEAVAREFSDIHIVQGDGNLYWSGGMRKAWQTAIDSGIKYDYYLWFNDDADLYEDALQTMFRSMREAGGNAIISGAFCDKDGKVSYGGWSSLNKIMPPNGTLQLCFLINGNLVLISGVVFESLGNISHIYKHSLGDWDYGRRAIEHGFNVLLTPKYVGLSERHNDVDNRAFDNKYSLRERWSFLRSSKQSNRAGMFFFYKHFGLFASIKCLIRSYIYVFFPLIKTKNNRKL